MRRAQLQHVIFEIGRRFGINEFHIVGSAAILAALPDPPEGDLTATRDVDVVAPCDDQQLADRISFVLGEASDFDLEHGYYAQGVTSRTPEFAPSDWPTLAIPVRVENYTGWCMDPHALVLSKLGAGREKDFDFSKSAARLGLVHHAQLLNRLEKVSCSDDHRRRIAERVNALFS